MQCSDGDVWGGGVVIRSSFALALDARAIRMQASACGSCRWRAAAVLHVVHDRGAYDTIVSVPRTNGLTSLWQ